MTYQSMKKVSLLRECLSFLFVGSIIISTMLICELCAQEYEEEKVETISVIIFDADE